MARLVRLTKAQWTRLEAILPKRGGRGRPGLSDRTMVEAMLWILRTGAPWRDLPDEYGSWKSVYTRFSRWTEQGVLQRVFDALTNERDGEGYLIDGTIMRAHQDASGAVKKKADKRLAVLVADRRRNFTR